MAPSYLGPFVHVADLPWQSVGSVISKHQTLGVPAFKHSAVSGWTFQVSRSWIWNELLKTLQWRRHCQSFGIDWRHTSARNHILILCFDISVDTFSGPCSDVTYLGHFKSHWVKLNCAVPSATITRVPVHTESESAVLNQMHTTTPPQPFYGPFSRTTRVSQCQKRTSGLYGARED